MAAKKKIRATASKKSRAPATKKVTLSAGFRKRFADLEASAASPDPDEIVRVALENAELMYQGFGRGLTLGQMAEQLLPHVSATLTELARIGALRYLPRAEAYVPGRLSDAQAADCNVEGGLGARKRGAAGASPSMPAALEKLAKAIKGAKAEAKLGAVSGRRAPRRGVLQ